MKNTAVSIVYITNVKIPEVDAQSAQIQAMARAFGSSLGQRFCLVSPATKKNEPRVSWDGRWEKVRLFLKHRNLRSFELCFRSTKFAKDRATTIFTRDIFIAFFYFLRGHRVLYELHQRPSLKAKCLINYMKKFSQFKIIAISGALKSYCEGEFSLRSNQVLCAHDGITVELYQEGKSAGTLKSLFPTLSSAKIILHTGSLYHGRGGESFDAILKHFPDIAVCHIGGSENVLSAWRKKYEKHPNFFSHVHVDQTRLISAQMEADILLFPMTEMTKTFWCASPMKMFEYMAAGRPIVSTCVGSTAEIFNESNCYPYKSGNDEDLCRAIREVIADPREAERRALNAQSLVRDKYTWNTRVRAIIDFIEAN